jgi:hypothetical protein
VAVARADSGPRRSHLHSPRMAVPASTD